MAAPPRNSPISNCQPPTWHTCTQKAMQAANRFCLALCAPNLTLRPGQTLDVFRPGRSGGAVLAAGEVLIDNCIFAGNQAGSGPAVSNTVTVALSSTRLDGNTLTCDGDRLFLDWKDVREPAASFRSRAARRAGLVVISSILPWLPRSHNPGFP